MVAGLHVRNSEEDTYQTFTYAWAPVTAEPQGFNWTSLNVQTVSHHHLQCHVLQEGYDLPMTIASLDSDSNALGLILCNTENSYNLSPELRKGQTDWKIPVMVVTSESGRELQEILSKHPGKVEVEVLLSPYTPAEHTEEDQQQGECETLAYIHNRRYLFFELLCIF